MIRNIDGKIIKEGKLRTALRGVFQTGTYIESLDGSVRQQESILNSIKSVSPNNDTSEIFGEPSSFVHGAESRCIHELRNPEIVEGAAVALPLEAVEAVSSRFINTLYGYFIADGICDEGRPWFESFTKAFVLNIWTPNTDLKKDVIKSLRLGEIASCPYSWGRNTYARALVEFSTDEELKESFVIAIPLCNGKGHTLAMIDVEYMDTTSFAVNVKETDDGFTMVTKKNSRPKLKQNVKNKQVEGIRLTKPALNLQYRRVDKGDTSKKNENEKATSSKDNPQVRIQRMDNAKEANNDNNITIKNSFGVLTEDEEMERNVNNIINDDSECEEVDEEMVFDDRNGEKFPAKGASTPITNVSND
ncbi:hypothetical protein Tco_1191585 [Tanacetum coccineum]